ncbi:hypothetical protein FIBSPDRAFT_849875 [Athelia psychrophila]|uniref:Uncharacterized protein n=1 Tax=Athelia psychrophila TaxID=1759441 RepID=A0A166U710_9AGAM|nr:hypothetical protein FIBSPDRAFT_849875 [Fibularhizoctonia sp. CBS 109695]
MIVVDGKPGPPPTFDQSADDALVEDHSAVAGPSTPSDAPPSFAPYEADYFTSGDGTVISHDPHLNKDGEALYRFLLSQALAPPTLLLHCAGTRDETRFRVVSHKDNDGKHHSRTESYTETVTDFDFLIDLGQHLLPDPVHWSVPDAEPAFRGRMVREVQLPSDEAFVLGHTRRKAPRAEVALLKAWQSERTAHGLPPWAARAPTQDPESGLRSSRTVRDWADAYCASPKRLKEFTYTKAVHGWDLDALTAAVRAGILATGYAGAVRVSCDVGADKICVRPDNRLARVLSNGWLKLLLMLTLVYPFIWLFRRFHSRGGGRWEVCGGAYALKRAEADAKGGVVGLKEGQWLRRWEGSIRYAVATHVQTAVPLTTPDFLHAPARAMLLDGYLDEAWD